MREEEKRSQVSKMRDSLSPSYSPGCTHLRSQSHRDKEEWWMAGSGVTEMGSLHLVETVSADRKEN